MNPPETHGKLHKDRSRSSGWIPGPVRRLCTRLWSVFLRHLCVPDSEKIWHAKPNKKTSTIGSQLGRFDVANVNKEPFPSWMSKRVSSISSQTRNLTSQTSRLPIFPRLCYAIPSFTLQIEFSSDSSLFPNLHFS